MSGWDELEETGAELGRAFIPPRDAGARRPRSQSTHWRKVLELALAQRDTEFAWLLEELKREAARRGMLDSGPPALPRPPRPPRPLHALHPTGDHKVLELALAQRDTEFAWLLEELKR